MEVGAYSLNSNSLHSFQNSSLIAQESFDNFLNIKSNELLALAFIMYTKFAVYFILSALILLISMVGAIALILMPKEKIELQHSSRQITRNYISLMQK